MADKKYLNTVGSFECVVQAPGVDSEGKPFGWLALSKKKQTPSVRIPLMVTTGEHRGEITVHNLWLSGDAEDATTVRLAEVFGFDGDYKTLHKSKGFEGMPCNIETEAEVFEGKTRIKVKWLNVAGGGGSKAVAMTDDKVNSIFAKLNGAKHKALAKTTKATIAAAGGTAPTAAPAAGQGAAPAAPDSDGPPEDDSVPF